mgnify:CR=1 FL=1
MNDLREVDLEIEKGSFVTILGHNGSGKSTLMNIIGVLDKPTAGSVVLDGRELSKVGDADAAAFRRDNLGFVFQEFNLLDTFSLEDNIALPLVLAGVHLCFAFPFIHKLLILFNLDNRGLLIGTTAVSFAVFAVLYAIVYKLTGNTYYRIVAEDTDCLLYTSDAADE